MGLCKWKGPVYGKGVFGNNIRDLQWATVLSCQLACQEEPQCKSIDWKPNNRKCSLNDITGEDGLDDHKKFVYYEKDCPPGWDKTIHFINLHIKNILILSSSSSVLENGISLTECGQGLFLSPMLDV